MHIDQMNKKGEKDMQCTYKRNTEELSRNHCCSGKAISITYSECVSVGLVIRMQCACAILYCHLWPVRLYHIFPHYLINGTIFGKEVIESNPDLRGGRQATNPLSNGTAISVI
jgi:hypothetical protein